LPVLEVVLGITPPESDTVGGKDMRVGVKRLAP
jgi:hypothetical protein